jgi:hypothetical protein
MTGSRRFSVSFEFINRIVDFFELTITKLALLVVHSTQSVSYLLNVKREEGYYSNLLYVATGALLLFVFFILLMGSGS